MILYGASGHGKVVFDTLEKGVTTFFFDDNELQNEFIGLPVVKYNIDNRKTEDVVITIGNNQIRKTVANKLAHTIGTVVSKSAIISPSAIISLGCQILQGSIIQAYAEIGQHTIINTGASVDHDCIVGDFCHIAPQVTLCGNVQVGEGTLIGAGSTVIPGIKIGKWCTIGAGSVVVKDIPDYATVVGNPGRIVKIKQS